MATAPTTALAAVVTSPTRSSRSAPSSRSPARTTDKGSSRPQPRIARQLRPRARVLSVGSPRAPGADDQPRRGAASRRPSAPVGRQPGQGGPAVVPAPIDGGGCAEAVPGEPAAGVCRGGLTRGRVPSQAVATVTAVAKSYREVRKALAQGGWSILRQRGSHEVWAHPQREERIIVAGKESDPIPTGTLSSIRRASGLEHLR